MVSVYIMILGFLAILAAFDLFVGVSNDAVNFLSPAIGSRAAPFKVILIVASIGVLAGATFSSGMMEIARKGVFNPQMFTFAEIMVVFFGVMVTDVLLLDVFNSLGLPTSTTVSIVFELLGGALAAAFFKIWTCGEPLFAISHYINSGKALAIVSGILISVVVAFIAGCLVQYITRLIFTFNYRHQYHRFGSVFGGMAITAIFYFLVMKGAKGASFMRPEYLAWISAHTLAILGTLFVALSALFQVLIIKFRVNVLRIIILAGTFALAFAFAGNDLVNFVGVPIAALDSWNIFHAGTLTPDTMMMDSLLKAAKTPTTYLLLAGGIMVLTLWFSKKAHKVVQTTVGLSSSRSDSEEQFQAIYPGRVLVRSGLTAGKVINQLLPNSTLDSIRSRMRHKDHDDAAFDELRACVNLIVASILIASATSLKLPLSTTYVTFMVAMGSSFADGAWDRESAVYRVSGVITVIGGWFFTAFAALALCVIVTTIALAGGTVAIIALMCLVGFMLIRSNFLKKEEGASSYQIAKGNTVRLCEDVKKTSSQCLTDITEIAQTTLQSLGKENGRELKANDLRAKELLRTITSLRTSYYSLALDRLHDEQDADARQFYYRVFNNLLLIAENLCAVTKCAYDHVNNQHRPFQGVLQDDLELMQKLLTLLGQHAAVETDNSYEALVDEYSPRIDQYQRDLLRNIDTYHISLRSSDFYLLIIRFVRDILLRMETIAFLGHQLPATPASEKAC